MPHWRIRQCATITALQQIVGVAGLIAPHAPLLISGAGVLIGDTLLETGAQARAQYLKTYANAQGGTNVSVPLRAEACDAAVAVWKQHVADHHALFEADAATRTVDGVLQKRIVAELWKLTRTGGQA